MIFIIILYGKSHKNKNNKYTFLGEYLDMRILHTLVYTNYHKLIWTCKIDLLKS